MDFTKGFQMPPANKAGGNSVNTDIYGNSSSGSGLGSDMMDAASSRNNLSMRIDAKPYEKYGVSVNTLDVSQLDKLRAKNQGVMEQFGNSLARTVGAELIGGTISGFGALLDVITGNAFKADNDYTNFLTDIGDGIRKKVEDATPIYEENPDGGIHFGDSGYIFSHLPSIMSSLTLLIPAKFAVGAITKGASIISKVAKAGKIAANTAKGINVAEHVARTAEVVSMAGKAGEMSRFTQFVNYVDKAAQAGKYGKIGGKVASKAVALTEPAALRALGKDALTAAFSRYGENYQESRQLYKQAKDETVDYLTSMNDKEYNDWINSKKSELGDDIDYRDKEAVADALAKKSADRVFSLNATNVIFDFIQIRSLGKALSSTVASAETSWAVKQAQKLATKTLGKSIAESGEIAAKTASSGFKGFLQKRAYNICKVAVAESTEGIEEAINSIATKEGALYAKQLRGELSKEDTPDVLDRARQYLTDPTTWDAAIWGVIGGIAFQHLGKAYTKGVNRITKGKDYEPYADYEKKRIADIEARKIEFESAKADIDMINNGFNPKEFERDENGNPVFDEKGEPKYHAITNEAEKEILKSEVKNKLISRITLNAIKVGNYDLLKSYMNDKDVRQRYLEAGLDKVNDFDNNTREAIDIMDKTYNKFVKYSSLLRRSGVSDAYLNIAITNNIVNEQEAESIKRKIDMLSQRNDELANDNPTISSARNDMQFDNRFKVGVLQEFVKQMQDEIDKNSDNPLIVGINTKRINTAKSLINDYTADESDLYKLIAEQRLNNISTDIDDTNEETIKRDNILQAKIDEARTKYYELHADKVIENPIPLNDLGEVDLDKFDAYMNKLTDKLTKDGKFDNVSKSEKDDYLSSLANSIINNKNLSDAGLREDYLHEFKDDESHVISMTDFNDIAKFARDTNQEYVENLMNIVDNEIWHKGYTNEIITDQATARKKEKEFVEARKKDIDRIKTKVNKTIVDYYNKPNFEEVHNYLKTGNKGNLSKNDIEELDTVKDFVSDLGMEEALDKEYQIAKDRATSPVGESTSIPESEPASTNETTNETTTTNEESIPITESEPATSLTEEDLLNQYAASAPATNEQDDEAINTSDTFSNGFNGDLNTEIVPTRDMDVVDYGKSIGATPEEIALGIIGSYPNSNAPINEYSNAIYKTGAKFDWMEMVDPVKALIKRRDSGDTGKDRTFYNRQDKPIAKIRGSIMNKISLFEADKRDGTSYFIKDNIETEDEPVVTVNNGFNSDLNNNNHESKDNKPLSNAKVDVKSMTSIEYGKSIGANPEEIALGIYKSYPYQGPTETENGNIMRSTGAKFYYEGTEDMPALALRVAASNYKNEDTTFIYENGKSTKLRDEIILRIDKFAFDKRNGTSLLNDYLEDISKENKDKQVVISPKQTTKPVAKPKVKPKISLEETVDPNAKKELDGIIDKLLGNKRKYTLTDIANTKFTITEPLYLDDTIHPFTKFEVRQNRYGVGTVEFSNSKGKTARIDEDEFNKLIEDGKILPTGESTEAEVKESAIDEAFNRGKAIADIINNYVKATGKIKRNGRIDISIEDMMRYIRQHYGENVFSLYKEIKTTAYFMQDMSNIIRITDNKYIKNADENVLIDITSKSKEDIIKDNIDKVSTINAQIDTTTLPSKRNISSQDELDEYNDIMKLAPGTIVKTKINDGAIEIYNGETKVGVLPIVDIQPDGSYRKVNEYWNYVVNSSINNPNSYESDFINALYDVLNADTKQSKELIESFDLLRKAINSNEDIIEMLNLVESNPIYKNWIKKFSSELTTDDSRLKRANHILKLLGYNSNVDLSRSELYPAIQYSLNKWIDKLGNTYSYLNSIKNLVKQGTHDVVITNATSGRMIKLPIKDGKQTFLPINKAIYKDSDKEFDLYYPSNEDDNTVLYKDGDPHTNHNVDGKSYPAGSVIMFTTDASGNKLLVHTFPNSIAGSVKVGDNFKPVIDYVTNQIDNIAEAWLTKNEDDFASAFEGLNAFTGNKRLLYGLTLNAYPNGGRSLVFKGASGETYTIFFNELNGRRNIKIQVNGKDVLNNSGHSVVFMDTNDNANAIPVAKSVSNLSKHTFKHLDKIRVNISMQGIIHNKVPNRTINDNYGNNEKGEFVIKIPAYKSKDAQELVFPSYKDFLIDNNLIVTDTAPVTDMNGNVIGNFVATSESDNYSIGYDKNFSIGVKPKETIKPDINNATMTEEQRSAIDKELFEKGNSIKKIAHILGVTEYDSVLDMVDSLGVKLPEEITARKRRANESVNKVVYADINTKTGQIRIYNDWYNLDNEQKVRKLIHEALHYYMHSLSTKADTAVLRKEFGNVYDAYSKYVKSLDANSELAFNMKKYLNAGKNRSVQLEEFIVESLTSKELIRYLDSIKYDGAIENDIFKSERRSLFTRLLDLMVSLINNVHNDDVTLLTKVNNIFSNFNEEVLTESNESNESNNSIESNETTETNTQENNSTVETNDAADTGTSNSEEQVVVEQSTNDTTVPDVDTDFDIGDIENILDEFGFESSIKETPNNVIPSVKSVMANMNVNDRQHFNEMYENGQINIICS